VQPINDVPQARHDTFSMLEDTELNRSASAGVMANDTDIDGDTMIAVQQEGPAHGTLMLDPSGAFVYLPDADFFGTDYFTYYLSDTIDDSSITTATITVWPSNDAPVGFNDTYTATEDTVLKIMAANGVLTNDYDLDTGDMLRATLQSDPVSGTLLSFATDGSFQYLPAANFSGSDSFTYRVYDGAAYSADIVVTLTVQPTNDAPVAVNDAYTIASNRTLTVDTVNGLLTNDSDLDGDNLQSIRTGDTAHGTLTMQADGSFTYTPEADFTGTDSFTYQATDSKEASPDATVVISVGTNQPPTAAPDFFAVDEDTTLNLSAAHSILFNDTDPDGDALQAEPQSNPLYGTLSLAPDGALIYTPGQDFHGIDSFTYRAFDGIDYSDDATAIITVNPINDLPLAADDRYDAIKDTPLTIAAGNGLLANDSDIDGDNLQSIRTGDAAHGTLEVQADGSFTYTPELGFVGLDSFAYEAHDPDGAISSATVTIVVEERSIATPTPTVTPPLPEQPILPIQFVDAVYEVEEDGTTGQVHVTLKRTDPTATEQAVSVYYETINGTAQFDIDYLYKSDQVTIAAGETEASFTIDIVNDTLPEGDEEFWLRLSTSRIAMHKGIPARFSVVRPDDAIAAAHTAPATNIDDARVIIHDTHDIESVSGGVLQFSANTYNVDENDGEIEITVFRSGGSVGEVSVDYATIGQTATDGSDFTALAGTLTLQPDEVITSFTVPILPDTLEEGDETILLSLSSPTGDATLGTQHQAELTIIDKDYNPQGTLQFEHIAYRVNESDSVATIRVKRVGGSTSDIQVRYEMFDGTAQAGDDYRISRGLLRFGPGETLKSFDIDILQDGGAEGTETAYLQLSEPMGGANLGSQSEAILYIDDDDITDYGTIQLAKAAYHVREDTANAIITLERIGSSAGAVSVAYETIDSTAQAGEDYESMEGVMSFADGVTHATFAVPIIPDTETEGDEVLLLHLSSATGAILGSQDTVPLTIVDDDTATHAAGVLQFSKTTYYVGEDASYATIEVERIGGSSGTVTVDCTTSDDTAHAGLDYMPQSTTLTFLPDERTQTFEVEILPSAGGTVLLQLSNPGGDALIGSHDQSLLRIGNKTVSDFQMNTPFYRVNEQDGHITIIVERSGDISSPATIAYATRDKDAVSPDDYEAQDNILEFPAGDSILQFDITIMEDQKIEGNEVFEVVLIDGNKDQSIAEVLIEDNDYGDKSTIQFSSRSYSVSEDTEDGGLWINVFRAGNVAGEASIRYDIFANTAEEGMDYLYTTDILTFTDGQAMSGFKVMITDDNEVEGSETIDLRLQNVTGDGTWIGAPHQAILTIVDDNTTAEGTLEFSADSYEVMEDDTQKTITVFRTGGTNGTVTIDYVAFDGTAVEEEDFVRVEGTLTFEHGQSTATFEVPILDDDAVEGVEVLRLQLIEGSVTGDAVFGARNEAVLTIIDSDSVPEGVIRFSDPTYLVSENSALTDEEHTQILIGIEREGGSSKAVEVTLMTLDGTATDGKDYIAREDPIIFAAGETQQYFPITIKDDFIAEGDETVTLILTKPTNGAVLGTQNYAVLKIFDDEPPGVEFSAPHYQVSETALTVPITVTLVEPLTQTVYIDYHTEDGTATAGEDYDRVNGTLEFLPSETFKAFSVTVHNDMHVEPPEEVNLRLDIPDGLGRGEFISSTLTIQDPPILSDTGLRIIKLEAPATRMLAGFSNKLPITATVTYDGYQPVSEQKVQFHTNLGMIIPEDGIVMTDNFGRARIFLQGDGTEGIATIEAALINDANVQAAQPSANLAVELYLERLYLPIVSADSRGQPNLSFYATVDKKVIVVGGKEELSIKLERCVGIGVCLPVSNVKATIFTSLGTFGSTQSTTVREADDEGIVQVELDPGERPGTAHMRIIVEDDEAIGVRSTNIQVIHGPAESILLRANRNRLLVGDQTGIRAAITDAFGNPIPGQPIQFSVTGGSITPEQTSLNDAGIATANLTCPDNAADITITASIGDLSEQFSIACVPEGPDQIEWHVPQIPIEARLENTAHVRVRLLDVYDNPLPNQPVSFHSLFGDLDSPHMVTDSNGEATVTLSNPTLRIGPIAVNAASGRVHSEETITFTPLECVESEPNNFIRDADDLQLWNVACRGMLGPQEDEDDYYRIRVEASTALSVYLRDLPADYNLQLGFYNEEVIAQSIGYGLTDEHLAYQLEPHIDYYLRVSQREAAEPHTYTLSVLMHPHHRP
jgi:VCBS repeat-containing protein